MVDETLHPLPERLAAIEGFDGVGSLHNLGGDVAALARVLTRFALTYSAGVPELPIAAAQGDNATCWRICHSVRGACAAICATRIVDCVRALEAAIEGGEGAPLWVAHASTLHLELRALADQLRATLATEP